MRKAAGIILIILGMFLLVRMIINVSGLSDFYIPSSSSFLSMLWGVVPKGIVWGGLLVAGGVLCLKRRYWGLCLVSALLTFVITILPVVGALLRGSLRLLMTWETWILVLGALISTIFISLTKKEWKEIQG